MECQNWRWAPEVMADSGHDCKLLKNGFGERGPCIEISIWDIILVYKMYSLGSYKK